MRKLLVAVFSSLAFQVPSPLRAQQPSPQSATEAASCDWLSQIVSDEVRRAASSLKLCHNLERILARRGINSSQSFQNFVAKVQSEAGADANALPDQDERAKQQDLQDRQQMKVALNRRAVDTNLFLLRSDTVLLELQAQTVKDEQRAFRRTKILNIFLGTTVGTIGSGMQFSNNTSVQHAGDGVSVAGGVLTALFAACTAELEPPSNNMVAKAFQNGNNEHFIPETVWSVLKSDTNLDEIVDRVPKSQPRSGKLLDCRWRKRPDQNLATQVQFFHELENSIAKMSQADAELSRLAELQ